MLRLGVVCAAVAAILGGLPAVAADAPKVGFEELTGAEGRGVIAEWLVLGPFPNPIDPEGGRRLGYDKDYLQALGGEERAVLSQGREVRFDGKRVTAQLAKTGEDGVLPLDTVVADEPCVLAYAYAQIEAQEPQEAVALIGSDDWVKVWLNGALVLERYDGDGRGLAPGQDIVEFELQDGPNDLLVKVEQNTGPWGLRVELATAELYEEIKAAQERREMLAIFMDSSIEPANWWEGYVFAPGDFPQVRWEDWYVAQALYGDMDYDVRWFDAEYNEVTAPQEPGRYACYVEATTSDGLTLRRAQTFYCVEPEFDSWRPYRVEARYIDSLGIPEDVWDSYGGVLSERFGHGVMNWLTRDAEGAVLLAGLSEAAPFEGEMTQLRDPYLLDMDYHLGLKLRLLGKEGGMATLETPRVIDEPAQTLVSSTPETAAVDPASLDEVRAACRAWYAEGEAPMVVLLARNGQVYFHEAFGEWEGEPVTVENKFPLASLTKCHGGLLLAQFIEQGLVDLDDPVGKYVPDFPTEGPKTITLRHCVTHTTGYEGHGMWGGLGNTWLDNAMASGLETLEPGAVYVYNGMGFDLAGKVMEVVSGKSIFRLMHEQFFQPLGHDNPTIEDLGYGVTCTVEDLARVGQLILNKGSYGDHELISRETFEEQVMPRAIGDFFPDLTSSKENRYNLGLHYWEERRPDVEPAEGEAAPLILGENTIGHGAASGAVLRVDYDHGLVVAVARPFPGAEYDKHVRRFLTAVADGLR